MHTDEHTIYTLMMNSTVRFTRIVTTFCFTLIGTKTRNGVVNLNGMDGSDEGLGEEEGVAKPVLVIPFDVSADPSIGLLTEQKVTSLGFQFVNYGSINNIFEV